MKAAFITETGAPSVIQYGDLPKPQPGLGEVLVKVGAVAVNPIDTYIRGGMVAMPLRFPYMVGCDLAGTIEVVGRSVRRYKVGDRVWGSNQGLFGRQGTFGEYAVVDEKWLYPTPANETDAEAAAGALVGITAYLGLFRFARLQAGDLLFVNGGSGGVGSSVIQQAKAAGARVLTTVGSEAKRAYCLSLGADFVFDYRSPTLDDEIRQVAAPVGGISVWFETQREPAFDRTVALMAPRGRIVLMAGRQSRPEFPVGPFYTKDLSLIGFAMFNASADEQRECAQAINDLYLRGGWHPAIGIKLPLSQAASAHQLQQDNTLDKRGTLAGKIVLVPDA
ncbi:MAG TPA: NADPH:quinone reductase [Planctomycetaceae bacterium]|jgi:NADPH2:quinone reductase|nr:NADPH:quinone reductase [Planctomycetaceae bacterium]